MKPTAIIRLYYSTTDKAYYLKLITKEEDFYFLISGAKAEQLAAPDDLEIEETEESLEELA